MRIVRQGFEKTLNECGNLKAHRLEALKTSQKKSLILMPHRAQNQ